MLQMSLITSWVSRYGVVVLLLLGANNSLSDVVGEDSYCRKNNYALESHLSNRVDDKAIIELKSLIINYKALSVIDATKVEKGGDNFDVYIAGDRGVVTCAILRTEKVLTPKLMNQMMKYLHSALDSEVFLSSSEGYEYLRIKFGKHPEIDFISYYLD